MKKKSQKRTSRQLDLDAKEEEKKPKMPKFDGKKAAWEIKGTMVIGDFESIKSEKVIGFDMDDTLICPKSGRKFAINWEDWKFLMDNVPKKLKEYNDKGYKIVIFTNQNGIKTGKTTVAEFKMKLSSIQAALGIPIQVFAATDKDIYRKPSPEMWNYFKNKHNEGMKVDMKECMYVGDAAGRPASGTKKKDFSDSDLKFALNAGLKFNTPEEFFLGLKQTKMPKFEFDPTKIQTTGPVFLGGTEKDRVDAPEQEVILFSGSPASGKSSFWDNYLPKYGRVNRDTLKTMEKCEAKMREYLDAGESCVIDNTNPDKASRARFIQCAKEYKLPIRCFVFKLEKKMVLHLDTQRNTNVHRKHLSGRVGQMPINIFFSKFQMPTIDEGFAEVKTINFVGNFTGEKDKTAFMQFS